MINKLFLTTAAVLITGSVIAQKADGTTKSMVKAENEFAESLAKDGAKKAFSTYAADNGLVFRPNPVNAKTFYASQPDDKSLSWKPVYAKMSKSGDWGFTTGPFLMNGTQKVYGQYISIWKARNGEWELAMDMGIEHNKPLTTNKENFIEPAEGYKPKMFGVKEAALGKDIVSNTESTLNATLKSYGVVAFLGFLNPDARLLFPGNEPIIGKDKIVAFNNSMFSKMALKTTGTDKANGGDLAYTYGVATVDYKADLRETFNYVFVWERQADHNWNIIAQMFVPAER